jgi:histone-lysine N-methyltransferase SETMAR
MLCNELKPAIRTKCQGLVSEGVLLLLDSMRPHTAFHTVHTLQKLGYGVLEHPAYSVDLASSEYHLFGAPEDVLRGHEFATDEHVQEVVHSWLRNKSKPFFSEGINKLVAHWNKCTGKQGDNNEK